ncbi:MAG: pentapeptide repeat-containing protein [Nostocaceae cyanobacterium]|nr:pentapeptide repeat-containing protein [Nostocaceae cyanobacterium]
MANQYHVDVLKKGVDYWNQWRKKNPNMIPELQDFNFSETSFSTNFYKYDLRKANLARANLYKCDLSGANLEGANIYCSNLNEAKLIGTNLSESNLNEAHLFKAELI